MNEIKKEKGQPALNEKPAKPTDEDKGLFLICTKT